MHILRKQFRTKYGKVDSAYAFLFRDIKDLEIGSVVNNVAKMKHFMSVALVLVGLISFCFSEHATFSQTGKQFLCDLKMVY